jgi:hypothetical protein
MALLRFMHRHFEPPITPQPRLYLERPGLKHLTVILISHDPDHQPCTVLA